MTRRSALWAALAAAFVVIGSCGREPTGLASRRGGLVLAPRFAEVLGPADAILDFGVVRVLLSRPGSAEVVVDTTIPFPASADSLTIVLQVPIEQTSETFSLRMAITDAVGDTVFRVGPADVVASTNPLLGPTEIPEPVYVGVGANAIGVRFVTPPVAALFSQVVPLVAEAFDGGGAAIPGTPIGFELVTPADSTRARFLDRGVGSLTTYTTRGDVAVRAYLLTAQSATHTITVQPVANAMQSVSGNGQLAMVGAALPEPVVARVIAADNIGVVAVPVDFRLTRGTDTLAVVRDTSDANGLASFTPTLGTVSGAYAISATATVSGGSAAIVNYTATATPAVATRLEFTVQPTNVLPLAPISPAVVVTARDVYGNVASGFTGGVTVEMLDNPQAAVLSGTVNRPAIAGVATFGDLTLNGLGTGLTLRATAAGVASDTSATFDIAVGAPARVEFIQQPTNITATASFSPSVLVAVRDAGGTTVPTATDLITLTILDNPTGAVLAGPTSVAAVAGVANFAGLSIARAGNGFTLLATAAALDSDTSAAFNVAVGVPTVLAFTTQPPVSAIPGTPFTVQVGAHDAGMNLVTSFAGTVTMAIGTNPASGSLSGTTSVVATSGVASFTDLALDNLGTGYTLVASAAGLTNATSNPFDVAPPPEVNSWINLAGGNWNTAANWSQGTVPTAGDTVWIKQTGTYTVTLDGNITVGRVELGGSGGTQTLALGGSTLTLSDSLLVGANGSFVMTGGQITGAGTIGVDGSFGWGAGSLTGGGRLVVGTGGALSISGAAARSLSNFTIEIGGLGTWTGTAAIGSGAGAVLRVLPTGNLQLQNDGGLFWDQGGAQTIFDVQGGVTRTIATDTVRVPGLTGSGSIAIQSGVLEVRNSGTFDGSLVVDVGGAAYYSSGTNLLGAGSVVIGGGNVTIGGSATVSVAGLWSVGGTTRITGGTFDFDAVNGITTDLVILGGTKAGSGVFEVSGTMTWTAGNISGGGGITRVVTNADLIIDGAAARTLSNHILEIGGDAVWTGTLSIGSGAGARIRVLAGGTFDLQGGGGWFWDQGGAQSVFEVLGLVTRTVGTDTIRVPGLTVGTGGSAFASSGVLEARNNATSTGSLGAMAGGELRFATGTQTIAAGSLVTGSGIVSIGSGATVSGPGDWNVTGTTRVNGGTFDYDGAGGSTSVLELLSGSKGGSGLLTVSSSLNWTGGNLSGGDGTTLVAASGTATIAGTAARTLNAQSLAISGAATWSGSFGLGSGGNGSIRVLPGGTLDIQADPTWTWDQGGAQSFLEVQGTLTRSTSAGVAVVPGLAVSGTAFVTSGVLETRNTGSSSGTLTVSSGAELRFATGSHTLTGTALVNGAGLVNSSAGTLTSAGAWAVTGTTRVSGGTMNHNGASGTTAILQVVAGAKGGSGLLEVSGSMTWSAGNITGGGGTTRVLNGATLDIASPTPRSLSNHVIELAGTGVWSGSTGLGSGAGAVIRVLPTGNLDIQADPQWFFDQGGTQSLFDVQGTVTRTVSSGTVYVPGLSVSGSLIVSSGVLEARNNGTSTGVLSAVAPGELRFGVGTHSLLAGSTVGGTGIVSFINGSTTSQGTWNVTGTTRVAGGTFIYDGASGLTGALDIQGGSHGGAGILEATTAMSWSGGNISGGGGTARVGASATLTVSSGLGRSLSAHVLEVLGTANWNSSFSLGSGSLARLRVGAGGVLNVNAAPTFAFDQGGGTSILENLGTINVAGPGTTIVTMRYEDSGASTIASGATLDLRGGGNLGGPATTVAAGGALRFGSGTFTMQPTLDVTGGGPTLLDGATLNGLTTGDTARFSSFQVSAGALNPGAGGVVAITGFVWLGSASLGGGGQTLIPVDGTALFTNAAGRTLNNHTFAIAGTAIWNGAFTLSSGSGAAIRVRDGGILTIQPPAASTAAYSFDQGGGTSFLQVDPQGTMLLSGDGTFTLTAQLQHQGTTSQSLGTFNVNGGGILGGAVLLDAPATLAVNAGALTLADTVAVLGLGQAVLAGGTLLSAAVTDTAEFGRLRIDAGTVDPVGVIVVSDHLEWAGASSIAGGTVVAQDTLEITGTLARTLNVATLETHGVTLFGAGIAINSGSLARIRNMPTGSFQWFGDGDFLSNQGGGQSVLENQGQMLFSGTGVAEVSAFLLDTTSNAFDVQSGTLDVMNGGRLGGTVAGEGALQVSGGILTLKDLMSFTGGGGVRIANGQVTVDSGGSAALSNVDLVGGQMLHEGLITITGSMNWDGGELESNTVGLGGRTLIPTTASLVASGAAVKNLIGTHVLEIQGGASMTYGGSGNLQAGSGATIQNAGLFDLQGTGSVLWSLGGSAPRFRNLTGGTLQRSGATAGVVMNLPIENAGGVLAATADTLRLTGGSVTAFSGLAQADAAPIKLLGTFTLTGDVSVTGPVGEVVVASGSVVVGPNTLTIAGNLTVNGAGSINSTDPAAFIDVAGDASFSGNPTNLSAGILRIGGNFAQGPGGSTSAFTATATHQTYFSGTARQTISFANPGTALSRFATLDVGGPLSPRRLELLSNVFTGTFRDQSASIQDSIISAGNALLTTANADVDSLVFVGTRLAVTNGADVGLIRAIRFDLMDLTATQLQVDLNAGATRTINNAVFATTPTTGYYVHARQVTNTVASSLVLATPATPSSPGSFYNTTQAGGVTNRAVITWNGTPLPANP